MTIAITCRLAEEGKIAPEDPVSKYLPSFPRGDRGDGLWAWTRVESE